MARLATSIVAATLFGIVLLTQTSSPRSLAWQATPAPPVVIASEVLGRATPGVVENPELALGRVTIMPGAAIPVHYHAGVQIAAVVQGELSYSVFTGEIAWHRLEDRSGSSQTIEPGDTVLVRSGDVLVESPGSIHQGRNEGDEPVVIYLSTLFPADASRAIIVDATPIP